MSRKDAHAFAASLAATLMVSIVVFQAGDGTFGAVPADEIDGDEVQVIARSTRGHKAHGLSRELGIGAGSPIRSVRLSDLSLARKSEPTRRSARLPKGPNARCRVYGPPETSRKSFTRATLMK